MFYENMNKKTKTQKQTVKSTQQQGERVKLNMIQQKQGLKRGSINEKGGNNFGYSR